MIYLFRFQSLTVCLRDTAIDWFSESIVYYHPSFWVMALPDVMISV